MRALIAGAVLIAGTTLAYSKEIKLTPDMVRDVTAVIQAANFNCPLVKLAFAKGEDAYGTVVQVYCGPKESEGVYEKAVFRLTFRPNGGTIIKPWN